MKKIQTCLKCHRVANRPVVIRRTGSSRGKNFVEEIVVSGEYACECGKYRYFGSLPVEQINSTKFYEEAKNR